MGCRGAAPSPQAPLTPVPLVAPRADASPEPREVELVWTVGKGGERETWTVDAVDGVLSHAEGVRLAAGGRVWVWRESAREVPTTACPEFDAAGHELPPGPPPPPGKGLRVALEREDGAPETQEVVSPVEADGARDVEQSAELVGTVGPYVFVRASTYAYACGAHGNVGYDFIVWDARSGSAAWASEAPAPTAFAADWGTVVPREEAVRVLAADSDVADLLQGDPAEMQLTEVLPSYDDDVQLAVRFQITAPACYACSDGAWSSYTKSTQMSARAIPAALRAWSTPPPAVSLFARTHPDLAIGGWSRLGPR